MLKSDIPLKRSIAALLLPSAFLDRVNWTSKWCHTMKQADCPRFQNREEMYSYIQYTVMKDAPIDYLEFGVADGSSLRSWCAINKHLGSRFFGFDSFAGLPEDWYADRPKGTFDRDGIPPEIVDPRVQFHIGLFQDSLPDFLDSYRPSNRVVIHNDSDLYSSTLYSLTMVERIISPGTVVMFDEFWDALHEYRALSDYSAAYRRAFKIIAATARFTQVAVTLSR
jgi:hypothetical protein